jgi:hypothetical protein
MPSSNINRAMGLYKAQISTKEASAPRNDKGRFADQSRKTRSVLGGDDDVSFEDVLRKVSSPKH